MNVDQIITEARRNVRAEVVPDVLAAAMPAELFADRDKALRAWEAAKDALARAQRDVKEAQQADTEALREAVSAGRQAPGPRHSEKASRGLATAAETARQARDAYRRANGQLGVAYRAALPSLVPTATGALREAMENYETVFAAAQRDLQAAQTRIRAAYAGIREVSDHGGVHLPTFVPDPHLKDEHTGQYRMTRQALDRIDAGRPAPREHTVAESSFDVA